MESAAPLFLALQPRLKPWLASRRGCSSVVEHLLAKEDVASSSLVTRSSLRHTLGAAAVLWIETLLRYDRGAPRRHCHVTFCESKRTHRSISLLNTSMKILFLTLAGLLTLANSGLS